MSKIKEFLGIDVSKDVFDVMDSSENHYQYQNNLSGFEEFGKGRKYSRAKAAVGLMREEVREAMERAVSRQVESMERTLIVLATGATACPFVGLFGTVWGIMEAFLAMGDYRAATISAVGPGITDALVTTLGGLAAAIPCLVAYNYFLHRIRALTVEMENFSSEFLSILLREGG